MIKWIVMFLLLPCFAIAAESPGNSTKDNDAKFDQVFRALDTNNTGKLSKVEVELKAPVLSENFDLIDANHDKGLSKNEIREFFAAAEKRRLDFSRNLESADKDHNGRLTREEAKALPNMSAHFDEIDSNHDGELVIKEIADFVRARATVPNASK